MAGFNAVIDGVVTALLIAFLLAAMFSYGELSQWHGVVALVLMSVAGVTRLIG